MVHWGASVGHGMEEGEKVTTYDIVLEERKGEEGSQSKTHLN